MPEAWQLHDGAAPVLVTYPPGMNLHDLTEDLRRPCLVLHKPKTEALRDLAERLRTVRQYRSVAVDITGLTDAAQDLLLKVLEEPPDGVTLYVFCAANFEPRPTIISRCVTVKVALTPEMALEALRPHVPEGRLEDAVGRFLRNEASLLEIIAAAKADDGVVTELIRAFDNREIGRALKASRGVGPAEVQLLIGWIRRHLTGNREPSLERVSDAALAAWAVLLETSQSPGLAVRWGIVEILGS